MLKKEISFFVIFLFSRYWETSEYLQETKKICKEIIESLGASSIKDMGKIMGSLKKKYSDSIDFSKVNVILKGLLSQWNIQKSI